jgi:alginate O-acetyltransferase complex protein AlgJ
MTTRRHLRMFTAIAVCGVLVLPASNVLRSWQSGRAMTWNRGALFSLDSVSGWTNRVLAQAGISASPRQVVIGRSGWLYLGDDYEQGRTVTRAAQVPADHARARQIRAAAAAWEEWMKLRGVKAYRVMVAPNKESIYPEYLPLWAQPQGPGAIDALFAAAGAQHVDVRPALWRAKARGSAPLYYKNDTHWTVVGAAVAFQALTTAVGPAGPGLRWPGVEVTMPVAVRSRKGGDLARFLRISDAVEDEVPVLASMHSPNGSLQELRPRKAKLIVSPGALNPQRVLWLRDSFGAAMEPFMAATFAEMVQLHWDRPLGSPAEMAALIQIWRPDYVIVTVVERDARVRAFTLPPPARRAE